MPLAQLDLQQLLNTGNGRFSVRWLVNPNQPPLENVCLTVEDGLVADIRPASSTDGTVPPLMLVPPLVNAHTHLEFSSLDQPLQPPAPFPDWIRSVIRWRREAAAHTTPAQIAATIDQGLIESRSHAVQLIGEIASSHPQPATRPTPQCLVFREAIGLAPQRIAQQLEMIDEFLRLRPALEQSGGQIGISPHAPYSVHLDLLHALLERARQHQLPLAMHIAETLEERTLLELGSGPFADFLKSLELFDSHTFPGHRGILEFLELLAQAPSALIVHGNWLKTEEIQFIARHPSLTVVYCPRTHHWFGHPAYPLQQLQAAGIRIALGTDSRASNPDLSIWRELQHLLRHHPHCSPLQAVDMVTSAAATALRLPQASQPIACSQPFNATVLECSPDNLPLREQFLASKVLAPLNSTRLSGPDSKNPHTSPQPDPQPH